MEHAFFSLILSPIQQEEYPVILIADATCDKCGCEFQVRSPEDSSNLMNALAFHMLHCPIRIRDKKLF